VPVSEDQVEHARSLLPRFQGIRTDLDDSTDTLGKKIRRAEKEWVPYIVVVGKKEIESGILNVRMRQTKDQKEMSIEELRHRIAGETRGRPFAPLAEPVALSERPIFRG
jgi:threonyl-tRNA synthetase